MPPLGALSGVVGKPAAAVNQWLLAPVDARVYRYVGASFALAAAVAWLELWPLRHALYAETGLFAAATSHGQGINVFGANNDPAWVTGWFAAALLGILGLAFGVMTRAAIGLVYLWMVSYSHAAPLALGGFDTVLRITAFTLLISPTPGGSAWSFGRLIKVNTGHAATPLSEPDAATPLSEPDAARGRWTPLSEPDAATPLSEPDAATPLSEPDAAHGRWTPLSEPDAARGRWRHWVTALLGAPGRSPSGPRSRYGLRLLQWQLMLIYVCTVWLKAPDEYWRKGEVASYFGMSLFGRFPDPRFAHLGALDGLLTYGTLLVEALVPVLLWVRRSRWIGMALGLSMHLGIALVGKLELFSLSMLPLYLAFLEDGDLKSPHKTRAAPMNAQPKTNT